MGIENAKQTMRNGKCKTWTHRGTIPEKGGRMGGERKRMSRAKGCTLGCLAILVLMVAGVAGFFTLLLDPKLEEAALEVRERLATAYEEAKAEGKVPDDHAPLFDELVTMAEDEETTVWSAGLIAAVVIDPLADGTITDEEESDATTVNDFVKAHPDLGLSGFVQFLTEHPDLMERVRKLDSVFANQQTGGISR